MSLVDDIASIDALRAEIDALRPLPAETEQRVVQKLRLEWNYHSAKIEGGSLSFGETKALLLFGITAGQKPLRDHIEMRGHNTAIDFLMGFARNEEPLTESTIRELHKVILGNEPFQAKARTADGQITHRTITPGRYKKQPNHVDTSTGSMFYFATVEETPAKMEELVTWYRSEREKNTLHPVLLAAELHYKFVRIHPFDDGNGRMARLLLNLVLLQHGFPPAVVRAEPEQKEHYYRVLQAADAGNLEPFVEYIARSVAHSLGLMLRAAQGEDIDDDDDIYKEIALLKKHVQSQPEKRVEVELSKEVAKETYLHSLSLLFETIAITLGELDEFFIKKKITLHIGGKTTYLTLVWEDGLGNARSFITEDLPDSGQWILVESNEEGIPFDIGGSGVYSTEWERFLPSTNNLNQDIRFDYSWSSFKYNGGKSTTIRMLVIVNFEQFYYSVLLTNHITTWSIKKKYEEILSEDECQNIARRALRMNFAQVKELLQEKGKEDKR